MYKYCEEGDFIYVILKSGISIKGTVAEIEKIPSEWNYIITLKNVTYLVYIGSQTSTLEDLSMDVYKFNSAEISVIGIK